MTATDGQCQIAEAADAQTRSDQWALDRAKELRSLMHRRRDSRDQIHLTECGLLLDVEGMQLPNTNAWNTHVSCPDCLALEPEGT